MNDGDEGLNRAVPQTDDRSRETAPVASAEAVEELSPDDDRWLGEEPSATLEFSWIEDDLQNTPVDPFTGSVPSEPEMKVTPPPASRKAIRRPVVERVRPRAELVEAARVAPQPAGLMQRRPPIVVVQALPSRRGIWLAYAGAILAGVSSGVAVLLLGQ